jgi:ketosteroid isomerase-like protein
MPVTSVPIRKLIRRFIAVAALAQLLVLTGWAFSFQSKGSTKHPKAQKEDSRHQIDRLEETWLDATVKNDANVLESLLADDYVAIMSNGTLETKDQMIDSVRAGKWQITSLNASDRKVRFYGGTALVTSLVQVEGSGPDGNLTGTYRYTRVYAKDPRGVWKIVNFEANRLGHSHHSHDPGKS